MSWLLCKGSLPSWLNEPTADSTTDTARAVSRGPSHTGSRRLTTCGEAIAFRGPHYRTALVLLCLAPPGICAKPPSFRLVSNRDSRPSTALSLPVCQPEPLHCFSNDRMGHKFYVSVSTPGANTILSTNSWPAPRHGQLPAVLCDIPIIHAQSLSQISSQP